MKDDVQLYYADCHYKPTAGECQDDIKPAQPDRSASKQSEANTWELTAINNKSIAIVIFAGAIAGAVSAWLVSRALLPLEDAAIANSLAAIDARLARLEAGITLQPSPLEPEPVERTADQPPASATETAAPRAAVPRTVGGRPEMFELFDENIDPEERRARAYDLLSSQLGPARFMAIRALVELDDPLAAEAVRNFVEDAAGDPRMLRMAAGSVDFLGSVDDPTVGAQLHEYLDHENQEIRTAAARQLERRGDGNAMAQIVDGLAEGLDNADVGARSRAAQTLGRTRSESAVLPLTTALGDKSVEVRLRAAEGLGMTGSESSVAALTAALEDPSAEVRSVAARSLDRIRNPNPAGFTMFGTRTAQPVR